MIRALLLFLAIAILGSCEISRSSLFTKRKYTKGHYFDVAKHAPDIKREKEIKEKNVLVSADKNFIEQKNTTFKAVDAPALNKFGGKNYLAGKRSFSLEKTKDFLLQKIPASRSNKIKNNSSSNNKRSSGINFDGATLAIGFVGFILLTLLYTFSIMQASPGINPLAALVVAMLFAAVTVVTGVVIY